MTPFEFPVALLLLVAVTSAACNDLTIGNSAQRSAYLHWFQRQASVQAAERRVLRCTALPLRSTA